MTIEISPADVRSLCGGAVFVPGDDGYEAGRGAWQANVDQQPAVLAYPATPDEVANLARFARDAGLRIVPQSTGHNAAPLGDLSDAVLVRTSAMTEVTIDPERAIARVGGGVLWDDVVTAATARGLYPLHGSSPDVGVAGYSLGGGIGWLARKHGLQSNSLTAVELVTAEGDVVRADAGSHPELFWALRGGGGNFGVVTALEFRLYPYTEAYGGMLVWDWSDAARVLTAWLEWAAIAPDEVTTSWRILQVPDIEEAPAPLRGRNVVVIDGAVTGLDEAAAAGVIAPLRALGPELDLWATMPAAALARVHGDPEEPTPVVSGSALLDALDADAVATLMAVAGPGSGSELFMVELRQLGGALARVPDDAGALGRLDAEFALYAAALAPTPEAEAAGLAGAAELVAALKPWRTGGHYLNFAEQRVAARDAFPADTYARLRAVRGTYDPDGRMAANHPID